MSASQSGVFSLQEFTDAGAPLVGGRLYTYAYGTTTFKAAYTDKAGSVAHSYTSDGMGGSYIALDARGELPAPLYLAAGSYDIALKRPSGSTVWTRRADPVAELSDALRDDLESEDAGKGAGLVGVGDVTYPARSVGYYINLIKPVVASGGDDHTQIMTALSNRDVTWFEGELSVTSGTIIVPEGKSLRGANRENSIINYAGSGQAIYCGQAGNMVPLRGYSLRDFTVQVTNKTGVVHGIVLENAIHFLLENVTTLGPKNPNLVEALTGSGLYMKNGTFIGRVSHLDSRLWQYGVQTQTLATGQDAWTAAIVFDGQGEIQNNSIGMLMGDSSVSYYDANAITVRDMTIEGNYDGGISLVSGNSTTIDACYFEANGNYDVLVGGLGANPAPIMPRIINNKMDSGDLGTTPYGARAYSKKIQIQKATFPRIRDNAILTGSVPCIVLDANSDRAIVTGNRLSSSVTALTDAGVESRIYENPGYASALPVATPTLLNSWANLGGAYETAGYTLIVLPTGQTEIRLYGMVTGGLAGTVVLNLPAGLRPTARLDFSVGGGASNNIAILTNGDVVCTVKGSSSVSLRGIFFLV